jgi:hypothetical protein
MAPGAADRAFGVRRKLGQELPGFLFAAIRTGRVFSLGVHGLQEDKVLAASFTTIFIKRHDNIPPIIIATRLALEPLAGIKARDQCARYNTNEG